MRLPFIGVAYTLTLLAAFPGAAQQAKGGSDDFGPYDVVENWLKPVKPGFLEKGVAVFAESPDRIYVTTSVEFAVPVRGGRGGGGAAAAQTPPPVPKAKVLVVDRDGNVLEDWTQWEDLMAMPHYVTQSPYDPTKAVWVVSRRTDQVFKFSNDGKELLMTLGQDRRTMPRDAEGRFTQLSDEGHFGQPTSLAFLPDGSFYIAVSRSTLSVASMSATAATTASRSSTRTGSISTSGTTSRGPVTSRSTPTELRGLFQAGGIGCCSTTSMESC